MNFEQALQVYLNNIRAVYMSYMQKNFQKSIELGLIEEFSYTIGKRYAKIIRKRPSDRYGVAHSFVDMTTGDIFKPAGANAPAKGIRGNIYAEGGLTALDETSGIRYLR